MLKQRLKNGWQDGNRRRQRLEAVKKGISEIIGTAETNDKASVMVYRALRMLLCARCGTEITEDASFTRRTISDGGLRLLPQCQSCVPFTFSDEASNCSVLIESLLTPSTEEKTIKPMTSEQQQKIIEGIEQRLGPALRHGRHSSR